MNPCSFLTARCFKRQCDARKLITLCTECARHERLRGSPVDPEALLETYMLDCRRDLEESLDYLAEYWRDALKKMTQTSAWKSELAKNQWVDTFETSDAFAASLNADNEAYTALLQQLGLVKK